jgi:hypothetical protein
MLSAQGMPLFLPKTKISVKVIVSFCVCTFVSSELQKTLKTYGRKDEQ